MHGLFCQIRPIHLIGRESLSYEKRRMKRVTGVDQQQNKSEISIWFMKFQYSMSKNNWTIYIHI